MVSLRPLVQTDISYFLVWWRDTELIALTSGNRMHLTDSQAQQYFNEMLISTDNIHRMVEVGGTTIGHVSLKHRSALEYELQTIIGDQSYHNKGYGTTAIEQMLQLAKAQGAKTVILYVRPENARAIRAYEKSGFSRIGETIQTSNIAQPQLIKMKLKIK